MENETSNIESVLKQALQREDAPAGFADQLLLRVAHQKQNT
jgi:hypothetical protein